MSRTSNRAPLLRGALTGRQRIASIMGAMRRVLFTLFAAFALGLGGVTNAAAVQDCPMQQGQAAGGMHDCCDDEGNAPAQDEEGGKTIGCAAGMSCRTGAAVTTLASPNTLLFAAIPAGYHEFGEPPPASGPLQELFRPPRAL